MNSIALGVWLTAISALIFGTLLGLFRGSRRAILRLSLILVCVLVAFLLKDWLSNLVLAIKVTDESGNTFSVQQLIINALPEEVQKAGETLVIPLVRSLMGVVAFLWAFPALCSFTWMVVFPICKIFVKPKAVVDAGGVPVRKDNGKIVRKKHALVGGAVGLVQGVVVALCFCIPMAGLAVQSNRVVEIVAELEQTQQTTAYVAEGDRILASAEPATEGAPEVTPSEDGGSQSSSIIPQELQTLLADFENTAASKFFYQTCRPLFDLVSTVKVQNADGTVKKVVLSKQISALKDTITITKPLFDNLDKITEQLQNIQTPSSDGTGTLEQIKDLTSDGSALKETFAQLDEAKGNLSEEQKEVVNEFMGTLVDSITLPETVPASVQGVLDGFKETLATTDFTDVNFTGELEVIDSLTGTLEDIQNGEKLNAQDVAGVIDELSQSTLILPVLEQVSTDIDLNLTEEQKTQAQTLIDQLPEDTDQETLDILKNFLGL